jgi:hypothetical protein
VAADTELTAEGRDGAGGGRELRSKEGKIQRSEFALTGLS